MVYFSYIHITYKNRLVNEVGRPEETWLLSVYTSLIYSIAFETTLRTWNTLMAYVVLEGKTKSSLTAADTLTQHRQQNTQTKTKQWFKKKEKIITPRFLFFRCCVSLFSNVSNNLNIRTPNTGSI